MTTEQTLERMKLFAKYSSDGIMTDIGFNAAMDSLYFINVNEDELKAINKVMHLIDVSKGGNSETVAHLINLYSKLVLEYQQKTT